MNKELFKELALQAGGSHYPEVGGSTLEKFAELLVKECIKTIYATPTHCASTTFQLDIVECTIAKSIEALEKRFDIPHDYDIKNENRTSVRPTFRVSGH